MGKPSLQSQRIAAMDVIIRTAAPKHKRTRDAIMLEVTRRVYDEYAEKPSYKRSTFERDKDAMRNAPIPAPIWSDEYEDDEGKFHSFYYYGDETYRWPEMEFDLGDMQSLQLAVALLEPYKNLPAIKHLRGVAEKISEGIGQTQGEKLGIPVYFSPLADNEIDPEIWVVVLGAATRRKILAITYSGWKKQNPNQPRRIAPYAIVQLEGEWYIVGTAGLTDESLRQYKMNRILTAKETKAPFVIPADFDVEKILSNTFGRFIGLGEEETVTIRFAKDVATQIAGQKWHPQQKLSKPNKKGERTLTFPVSKAGPWPYYHVKSWILSWGANAEVLAPAELKDLVRQEIQKMAGR